VTMKNAVFWKVTSYGSCSNQQEPHGVTSQKTRFFMSSCVSIFRPWLTIVSGYIGWIMIRLEYVLVLYLIWSLVRVGYGSLRENGSQEPVNNLYRLSRSHLIPRKKTLNGKAALCSEGISQRDKWSWYAGQHPPLSYGDFETLSSPT
jgi:hypothetical protein